MVTPPGPWTILLCSVLFLLIIFYVTLHLTPIAIKIEQVFFEAFFKVFCISVSVFALQLDVYIGTELQCPLRVKGRL